MNRVLAGRTYPDRRRVKYKHCCFAKDEEGKHTMNTLGRNFKGIFISEPYKKCPNPQCAAEGSFGVVTIIEESRGYTRKCIQCGYRKNFDLPSIKKKIVYLDQFLISNLIKLLDKSHPSHEKIKKNPFWETLFIKLEVASKSQAIVCPDSFYHKDESLIGNIDFKLMRRLYEHFSSGKTFYPKGIIQRNQIIQHFEGWLNNKEVKFDFDPQNISFRRDLHTWSVGLRISVGGNQYPGQIENLQKVNTATKEQLKSIWERWQSEPHFGFVERIKEETLALGEGLINKHIEFKQRQTKAMAKIAKGEDYNFNLDDIMPPICNDVLMGLLRIARAKGLSEQQVAETIIRYFNDVDRLLEIPNVKISSVMFAGWARRAALGKKSPPKSFVDVEFISAYLPYCDALFVDKESALLLKEFPKNTPDYLRLKEFPAKVFSLNNQEDFLDYLDQLVAEIPSEQIEILKDVSGEDYAEPYWSIIEHEKNEHRDN